MASISFATHANLSGLSPRMRDLLADLAIGNVVRVKAGPNSFTWALPDLFGNDPQHRGRQHKEATVLAAERQGLLTISWRKRLARPTARGTWYGRTALMLRVPPAADLIARETARQMEATDA